MASIKLTGDSSGVITVSAPASAGTNTLMKLVLGLPQLKVM